MDQWNRTDSKEINFNKYGPMIFSKCAKTTQWNKEESMNNKQCWKIQRST